MTQAESGSAAVPTASPAAAGQPAPAQSATAQPAGGGHLVRNLGMFSVLCIGVNAIVGSGIYRLPGRMGHELGGASWMIFGLVGLMLITVGLCFAEAGGMLDGNGGPYVYAREAFGKPFAFGVGWMAYVTMVFSWAAVANGITGYIGAFAPEVAASPIASKVVVGLLVFVPGALNYIGVKPGAYATNFFTVAKLVPLAIFVLIGLPAVEWSNLRAVPDTSGPGLEHLGTALFVALFAVQGFEVAPIPAGEAANPRKAVPIAVIGSLVGCSIFYVLIQTVAYGTHPEIGVGAPGAEQAWSARPLADAAGAFMGRGGALLMSVGACISMMGFCVGSALATPRFLSVFAHDGLFPKWLGGIHETFGTPSRAVAVTTAVTLFASQFLDFDRLVDLANVAVTMQYAGTCAAITALRIKKPDMPRTYRVPGGAWLFPVLGIGVCVLFIVQAQAAEFIFSAVAVAVGAALALATWAFSRRGNAANAG